MIKTKQKSILQAVTLGLLLSTCAIQAQKNKNEVFKKAKVVDENYEPFSFGLRLKNMHLWHGFVVTPGPMVATNLEYSTRDKNLFLVFGVLLVRQMMLLTKMEIKLVRTTKNFLSIMLTT